MTTTSAMITRAQPSSRLATGYQREIATRLRKVSGQLGGVHAMYENGRYCLDVLDQLSAVRAATDAVALLIVEDHIRGCVRDAINGDDPDEKVDELFTVISRYVRSGRR
jgi:DNA-binding FrmR family transcriptional regulator